MQNTNNVCLRRHYIIAVKRREVKSKGEKERYTHLNAQFQRIARSGLGESPGDVEVACGSCWGHRHWQQPILGAKPGVDAGARRGWRWISKPSLQFISVNTCPYLITCRPQCWETSGQAINTAGIQLLPSADRLCPELAVGSGGLK